MSASAPFSGQEDSLLTNKKFTGLILDVKIRERKKFEGAKKTVV
jgi:hypothetical protein